MSGVMRSLKRNVTRTAMIKSGIHQMNKKNRIPDLSDNNGHKKKSTKTSWFAENWKEISDKIQARNKIRDQALKEKEENNVGSK